MREGFDRLGRDISARAAQRMCLQKRQYATKTEARDAAARFQKREKTFIARPYKCSLCSLFHLTTQTPEQTVQMRARKRRA